MFGRALVTNGATTEVAIVVAITVFSIGVWAATVGSIFPSCSIASASIRPSSPHRSLAAWSTRRD